MNNKISLRNMIHCVLVLMSLTSLLTAYNNHLFQNLEFKYKYDDIMSDDNYSRNPAIFNVGVTQDYNFNTFYNGLIQNNYKRKFDPSMVRSYGASFFSYKILDRKSTLATSVVIDWSKHYSEFASLEKNFYDHYFSFADSTTGNTTYYGPRLWVLYQRKLTDKFISAFQIEYGIERGLKDVYTECMTIYRNVDVKSGLAYHSPDGSFVSGVYGRIFDRQGKYEAVEDLLDAINFTYIGYHVYRPESPRSSNNKSDRLTGYESGLYFSKNNFVISGLRLRSSILGGATESTIKTGSSSQPVRVGYWVRKAVNLENRLTYSINVIRSEFGIIYNINNTSDWAKHGHFEVNLLDYNATTNELGIDLKMMPLRFIMIKITYLSSSSDVDYDEYIADFTFNEKLSSNQLFFNGNIKLNSISNLYIGYENSVCEPYFYWDTPEFKKTNIYLAWDRLFVFGRIGIRINAGEWNPSNSGKDIEYFGFNLSLSK